MVEKLLDLSKLPRKDLEQIIEASVLPAEVREEAAMLYDLTDPEGQWTPMEGADLSKMWTVKVLP